MNELLQYGLPLRAIQVFWVAFNLNIFAKIGRELMSISKGIFPAKKDAAKK